MIKSIIKGIISYIPVLKKMIKKKGTGGSISARYCYSVWLRHLIQLNKYGMDKIPETVAELGPGDSFGIGLCALLSGSNKYYAFDIIQHTSIEKNLTIFNELILLFQSKVKIPGKDEFPEIKPEINDFNFPSYLLTDKIIQKSLQKDRIESIKQSIKNSNKEKQGFIYSAIPWNNSKIIQKNSINLIFSQAVMEHVNNIEKTYSIMTKWLKNKAFISHQIDYKAHEIHKIWYGHWTIHPILWKIIMHGREYSINRQPHSSHIKAITNAKMNVINEILVKSHRMNKQKLAKGLNFFGINDFEISSAYIIAQKK